MQIANGTESAVPIVQTPSWQMVGTPQTLALAFSIISALSDTQPR